MTTALPLTFSGASLVVSTRDVAKRYGDRRALDTLTLQVPEGSVYLLVGPNGAGKTTTIKLLLGLLQPDAGDVAVFGLDPRSDSVRIRANVGYVAERTDFGHGWLPTGKFLEYHSAFYPAWDAAYAARLLKFFDVDVAQRLGTLSKGQLRRVHLVTALAHRPALLLLDEPFDGFDPFIRDETLGVLAEHLSETPTTVLLSTHHVEELERLADHVGVLRRGTLRAQLSADDLRARLRQYRLELPDGWQPPSAVADSVLRRMGSGREVQWTIWGDTDDVTRALVGSGAMVRDAFVPSLGESALALLDSKES
jgi:ABC-2 type transport system ATP-binding protein